MAGAWITSGIRALHSIVTAHDREGLSGEAVVTVSLTDTAEAPSGTVEIAGMVAETAKPGTLAAAYKGIDSDRGERLSYSLRRDAGGRFAIDPNRGIITVTESASLDFESASSHKVTVRVTDRSGRTHDETLMIAVLDVDETPSAKLELLAQELNGGNGTHGHGSANGSVNGGDIPDTRVGSAASGLLDSVIAADQKLDTAPLRAVKPFNGIAAIQAQLVEAGFNPGPVDGKMGPLTRRAISRYQEAHRLTDMPQDQLLNHMMARAHFRRGYEFQSQGDHARSIEAYDVVVRINPDHFGAIFNRGLAYFEERRYDRSIEDFDKILELRSDYAAAYANRGNAYFRQGAYLAAVGDYALAVGHWIWPW